MSPLVRVSRWVTITKIFIVVTVAVILLGSVIFFFFQENIEKVIKKEKENEVSLRGGLGFQNARIHLCCTLCKSLQSFIMKGPGYRLCGKKKKCFLVGGVGKGNKKENLIKMS